jgi:hypothetical protein
MKTFTIQRISSSGEICRKSRTRLEIISYEKLPEDRWTGTNFDTEGQAKQQGAEQFSL